jgi:hypothetical protein
MTAAPIRSFRTLGDNWKGTAVAVLSLGAAMALGVVSLAVSNTFLVLPPAGHDPDRLVTISERTPGSDVREISYPDYHISGSIIMSSQISRARPIPLV